ncbi:amidohydrolase family protein [Zavarzinia compransoris]|uniref:Amidohydrolase n=1 Tax=Zavarzinia compransoris TaxID=1264899 RepID=A0A317DUI1_9PROT|nr:amidohydrolase family protein [Zavarzinia compransoris]PWR18301.1 amidohydrolase [Zavarzinia compransoris]TDP43642.1 putative TIM-barrel fold metal-dependent hydrolase [Zavarzinia compransoris]
MNSGRGRIDVHHHLVPPAFVSVMERRGITKVAGAPLPKWSPEASLDVMDANGIEVAITSLSAPGVHFGDKREAIDLARRCNDFAAEMAARHPGRFGNFAVLPMPFTGEACVEAARALDHLGADGVVLLGSTDGIFLGDSRFDDLMAELDRRGALVFVHPNLHATSGAIGLDMPGFLMEFLCDTTRAALNLILTGAMERHPRINFILSHAGGFLPYIAWRASLANMMAPFADRAPQGVLTYIRRFYFDTALSPSPMTMAALRELVDPGHILFGSDFPFAPAPITATQVATLGNTTIWNPATRAGIDRAHALALLPRWRRDGDAAGIAPVNRSLSLRGRIRSGLTRPVVALVEALRNR